MGILKIIHVSCAMLTGASFFIRGIWMMQGSPYLQHRLTRMVPHLVDTLLLGSALAMLVEYHLNPFEHNWLLGKIIALLLYICLGLLAFRFAQQRRDKILFWLLALCVLAFIYYLALSKHLPYFEG